MLESKRFYLDVKENQRGRFIKIAEISADGRKNQVNIIIKVKALKYLLFVSNEVTQYFSC